MKGRCRGHDKPISIYEIHLGSWKGKENGRILFYEEIVLIVYLIPYMRDNGFCSRQNSMLDYNNIHLTGHGVIRLLVSLVLIVAMV